MWVNSCYDLYEKINRMLALNAKQTPWLIKEKMRKQNPSKVKVKEQQSIRIYKSSLFIIWDYYDESGALQIIDASCNHAHQSMIYVII